MPEVRNDKEFLDLHGLERFWNNVKDYLDMGAYTVPAGKQVASLRQDHGKVVVTFEAFGGATEAAKEAARESLGVSSAEEVEEALAGKADLVDEAVEGNLAELDAAGNLVDSGISSDQLKLAQQAWQDSAPDTTYTIQSVSQNENGDVSITFAKIRDAGLVSGAYVDGLMPAADKEKLDALPSNSELGDLLDAKADKVDGATDGNLPVLDSEGNLGDSGIAAASVKLVQEPVDDPVADGITLTAIDSITQDSNGVIAATKKTIQPASTEQPGVVQLVTSYTSTSETMAPTAKALKNAVDSIGQRIVDLDVTNKIQNGQYITELSQTDGLLEYEVHAMATQPVQGDMKPITSGGAYSAISEEHNARVSFDTRIESYLPDAVSSSNKLADKAYVDAIGERLEARYLASSAQDDLPFLTKADFDAAQAATPQQFYYNHELTTPDNNDVVVVTADESKIEHSTTGVAPTTRYRFIAHRVQALDPDTGEPLYVLDDEGQPTDEPVWVLDANGEPVWEGSWFFEYVINNSALNDSQLLAINSGITPTKRVDYDAHVYNLAPVVDQQGNVHYEHRDHMNPHGTTYTQVMQAENGLDTTAAELQVLHGIQLTTDELNTLDGISTEAGVTVQSQLDDKIDRISPKYTQEQDPNYTISGKIAIIDHNGDVKGRYGLEDSGAQIRSTYDGTDATNPVTGTAIAEAISGLDSSASNYDPQSQATKPAVVVTVAETGGSLSSVTVDASGAATAAQGELADSAVQAIVLNGATVTKSEVSGVQTVNLGNLKTKQDAVTDGDATTGNTPKLTFVDQVTQDDNGEIAVHKEAVKVANTYDAAGTDPVNGAAITDALGTLYATESSADTNNVQVTVSQSNGKITGVSVVDNSMSSGAVDTKIATEIGKLDASEVGGNGKYITTISESDGVISATAGDTTTSVTENSTALVTSGGVYAAINALDYTDTPENSKFVTEVNESNGKISVTRAQPTVSDIDGLNTALNAKIDKVTGATAGDIPAFVAGGGIADSGKHVADKYRDTTQAEGHQTDEFNANLVTGKAVSEAIAESSASSSAEIAAAIAALDSTFTSTDGKNVQVKVDEVDGKITGVSITTDNTASKTDLTNAISDLDANVSSANGSNPGKNVDVQVVEEDGKVTAVNIVNDSTLNQGDLDSAIGALDATVSSAATGNTKGKNVDVQVVEENGVITQVNIVKDDTVNASDVSSAISTAIGGLDANAVGGTGKYITTISESDGVISATAGDTTSSVTADSAALVTSGGVASKIASLDFTDTPEAHKFVTKVDEADGIISVTRAQPSFADISGTAEISQGGTGATSAADARDNLGVYSKTEVDNLIAGQGQFLGNLTPTQINALWSSANPPGNADTVICVVDDTATPVDDKVDIDGRGNYITVRDGEQLIISGTPGNEQWESTNGKFKLIQQGYDSTKPVNDDFDVLDGISQTPNGEVTVTRHSLPDATSTVHGLMTAAEKVKLGDLPSNSDLQTALDAKADKVTGTFTAGDLVTLDQDGNIQDSGAKVESTYTSANKDDTVNPVTASAVTSAISGLDATVASSGATGVNPNIGLTVVETDGKISSVTVTSDNTATKAQGALADTAIQKVKVTDASGTTTLVKDTSDGNAVTLDLTGYKPIQAPVTTATADTGSTLTFISSVTQDDKGVITPKTKTVKVSDTYSSGSSDPISGKGVSKAFETLDAVVNSTAESGVTPHVGIRVTEEDGKVTEVAITSDTTASSSQGAKADTAVQAIVLNGATVTKSEVSGVQMVDLGNLKTKQTAVTDADATTGSTPKLTFVDMVTQSDNGVISVHKESVTVDTAYNHLGTNPVSGQAVAAALDALTAGLDATESGSGTNVSVSVTQTDGLITSVSVTDNSAAADHDHGKIDTDGKIGNTSGLAVVTSTGGAVDVKDMTYAGPSSLETDTTTEFIDSVTQGRDGQVSATKRAITPASTSAAGIVQLQDSLADGVTDKSPTVNAVYDAVTPKADKAVPSAAGNIATLSATGNLVDSGKSLSDLATAAQGTLAESAVQDVKIGDTSMVDSSTHVATIRAATTSVSGVVQLTDSHSSNSTTTAATPKNVKEAYDLAEGKYTLPSGGIPKADLASAVQASLGKADSAVQDVKYGNQSLKDSNNVVTLAAVSASTSGVGGSDGFMLATDKEKLDGVATGAQVNVIETVKVDGAALTVTGKAVDIPLATTSVKGVVKVDSAISGSSENPVQNKAVSSALDGKVDKVAGKGLSTEDYTTAEKNKLAGIAAGAEVNQDAFAKVKVGSTLVEADSKTDTLEIAYSGPVTVTPDTTNDKITIGVTVDSSLSGSSENPVQNKVVDSALSGKADKAQNLTGATKTKITYNSQGIVTAGADLVASDIPSLPASKITSGEIPVERGGTGASTVSGAQTNLNVYDKSEVYTKTEVDNMVAGTGFEIAQPTGADNHPDVSNPSPTKIYLVKDSQSTATDPYTEWIYIPPQTSGGQGTWEIIGETTVDLSDYYKKTETDTLLDGKVDKVAGKGLSTNDYTTAEKNKLAGIAAGAEVNQNAFSKVKVGNTEVEADSKTDTLEIAASGPVTVTPDAANDKVTIGVTVDSSLSDSSTNPVQNKVVNAALAGKVDKVAGKGLSTNDYTDAEKTKLAGITDGANKVEASETNGNIKIDGTETAVYTHPSGGANTSAGETENKTPGFGQTFKVLRATVDAAGHTTALSDHTVTIPSATAVASSSGVGGSAGLMSASDKEKLNNIASGAQVNQNAYSYVSDGTNTLSAGSATSTLSVGATGPATVAVDTVTGKLMFGVTVDSTLDGTSTNPVQNKAINTALSGMEPLLTKARGVEKADDAVNGMITGLHCSASTDGSGKYGIAFNGNGSLMWNSSYIVTKINPALPSSYGQSHKFDGLANYAVNADNANIAANYTNNGGIASALATKQNVLDTQTAYTSVGSATTVPQITTNALGQVTGITEVTISGVTPASHDHGNISNDGVVTGSDAIASGDAIAVVDASDSGRLAKTSVTFDGSTTTQALTKKGTWENIVNDVKIDGTSVVSSGTASIPMATSSVKGVVKVDSELSTTSTNPVQNKVVATALGDYALLDRTYGRTGYISSSAANSDIYLEKLKLGSLSLYNEGVTITVYEFDEGDEENATQVWTSSTLTGAELEKYKNGEEMNTIYTSPAGKWVKVTYTGSTNAYIRALGIFMTPKYADSSHTAHARVVVSNTAYEWYAIATYGSLVTATVTDTTVASCSVIFKPDSNATRMKFYGFRCLNTYTGTSGVLIGRSSSAVKLAASRKLAVSLSNTSTDTSFNGTADVTNIKVSGTLGIANGGTGATTAKAAEYAISGGIAQATATLQDNFHMVFSQVGDACNPTNGVFLYRTTSTVWNYMKGKMSSDTGVNISGNAATATALSAGADRTKLDGISAGANKVESSDTNGNIKIDGAETTVYTHPTSGANTTKGETQNRTPGFGGTFKVVGETVDSEGHTTSLADYTVTIPSATAVASTGGTGGSAGLMSAADKEKLTGVAAGAQVNVLESVKIDGTALTVTDKAVNIPMASSSTKGVVKVDDALSSTSTNPVQNKVVQAELATKIRREAFYTPDWSFGATELKFPPFNQLNEGFYSLRKRGFNVTGVITKADSSTTNLSTAQIDSMFDGTYEHMILAVGDNETLTVSITPRNGESILYIGTHCYGYFIAGFYHTCQPESVKYRFHHRNAGTTYVWDEVTATRKGSGGANTWVGTNNSLYYNIDEIQIVIAGKSYDSATYTKTVLPVLQFISTRTTNSIYPYIRKYGPETLYDTLTAPEFIGTLNGKFKTARELAVSLSNTSTTTSFDGSANVTNIKVSGTLPVSNGGTGATDAATARSNLDAAKSVHTHGNMTNYGVLANTPSLANGDSIAIADASDSNKLARSSITFDGTTTTKALTPKGTWEDFTNYSHPEGSAANKTGKPTSNQTPGFGSTFTISQITTDATSHVKSVTDYTVKIPDTAADASTKGLVKLYTSTGTNTDGTMTQSAIKTALDSKQDTISWMTAAEAVQIWEDAWAASATA